MNVSKIRQYVRTSYTSCGESISPLASFYKEGRKNPMLALIWKNDEINKITDEFRSHGILGYYENQSAKKGFKEMYKHVAVQTLRQQFWSCFNTVYPKSGLLRVMLCKSNRVHLDYTRSKAGDTFKTKLKFEYQQKLKNQEKPENIL